MDTQLREASRSSVLIVGVGAARGLGASRRAPLRKGRTSAGDCGAQCAEARGHCQRIEGCGGDSDLHRWRRREC
jgi:hypothetical protein